MVNAKWLGQEQPAPADPASYQVSKAVCRSFETSVDAGWLWVGEGEIGELPKTRKGQDFYLFFIFYDCMVAAK